MSRRSLALAALLALALGAVAYAATQKITAAGAGHVGIGMTYTHLRNAGRVGKIGPGCELGGPNTRSAQLNPPLQGSANFTLHSPRKVTDISITGGAKARGVGIGDSIADIKAAYPQAKVDHSTEQVFNITLVKIPKAGGGRIQFAVDTGSKKISLIGIPIVAFCD
jgi:hypothetical protein